MTMTLIQTVTLGSSQASITFSSIPQTHTDLLVVVNIRGSQSNADDNFYLTLNGSTSGYTRRALLGTGSAVQTATNIPQRVGVYPAATSSASTFGNASIYIPNYTAAINKSYLVDSVMENNSTGSYQMILSGLWSNTAAITSVAISDDDGGNLLTGSTASLYGILKGSGGATIS